MKWDILFGGYDLDEFLNSEDEVKDLKTAEIDFEDGDPIGIVLGLKDGRVIYISSKEINSDGGRQRLLVTTMEGNKSGK